MRYRSILLLSASLISLLGCAGCESDQPNVPVLADLRLKAAVRQRDDTDLPTRTVVEVKVPVTTPQLRSTASGTGRPLTVPTTGPAAIAAAKNAATAQPSSEAFLNAIQYYDYAPGVVYTALTSPGFVTTVALAPGEKLITAAAGDTTRWVVQSVDSGSGATAQTLLLIKPRKGALSTNLVITTDQRVYTLDLSSTDAPTYHTMIAWHYPFGDVVMIRNQVAQQQAQVQAAAQATVASGMDLAKANFNYLIVRQKNVSAPAWCPLRAFDDGRKTYIQFPPKVAVTEAPPLFVLGRKGDAQLVNYRVKGEWYIVDRLFDKAELRMGMSPQTVIRIQRAEVKD
jgi:P-type conjugative transfer protein TrbG